MRQRSRRCNREVPWRTWLPLLLRGQRIQSGFRRFNDAIMRLFNLLRPGLFSMAAKLQCPRLTQIVNGKSQNWKTSLCGGHRFIESRRATRPTGRRPGPVRCDRPCSYEATANYRKPAKENSRTRPLSNQAKRHRGGRRLVLGGRVRTDVYVEECAVPSSEHTVSVLLAVANQGPSRGRRLTDTTVSRRYLKFRHCTQHSSQH